MNILDTIHKIDPFVLAYCLGLLILFFFVRERLDVPGGNNAEEDSVEQLVYRLPPSSVRVRRYFAFACLVYFAGLTVLFTGLCALMVMGFRLDWFVFSERGFSASHASDALQLVTGFEPDNSDAVLSQIKSVFSGTSRISEHPWNPPVIALGIVGVLPSVPIITMLERRIRRLSLWVVGIPNSVVSLGEALRKVEVRPILKEPESDDDGHQVGTLKHLYQSLTGESETDSDKFAENIAKVFCYAQITRNWPKKTIRTLFARHAPNGLNEDILRISTEINHLRSLSLSVEAAAVAAMPTEADTSVDASREDSIASYTAATVDGSGFAEGKMEFEQTSGTETFSSVDASREDSIASSKAATVDDKGSAQAKKEFEQTSGTDDTTLQSQRATESFITEAKSILKERWRAVAKQLEGPSDDKPGQIDLCCLMLALYAERSSNFNSDETPQAAQKWVKKAREALRSSASSLNIFLFATMVALVLASGLTYALLEYATGSLKLPKPAETSSTQAVGSMALRLAVILFPTSVAVYMVRAALDREGKWRPWTNILEPRMVQYLGIVVFAFVSGALAQLSIIYGGPRLANYQNQIIPLSDLLRIDNLSEAAVTAIPGTVLAVALSLVFDQEKRKNSKGFAISITLIGLLLPVILGATLFLDKLFEPLPQSLDTLLKEGVFDYRTAVWLMTIGVALVVFFFVVASILKQRKELRKTPETQT